MKRFGMILCTLLALALVGVLSIASAEGAQEKRFVPGEDLLLFDQGGVQVTLKGEQPGSEWENGYCLNVQVENTTDKSVEVLYTGSVNGMEMMGEYEQGILTRLLMHSGEDQTINILYEDITWRANATPEAREQLSSFQGIETMELYFIVQDVNQNVLAEGSSGTILFNGAEGSPEAAESVDSEPAPEAELGVEHFTRGTDLVLVDQDGLRISLKGGQPADIWDNSFNIGLRVENNSEQMLKITYQGEINGCSITSGSYEYRVLGDTYLMNTTETAEINVDREELAWRSDDPAAMLEQLKSFEGIESMKLHFFVERSGGLDSFDVETAEILF